MQIDLPVFSTDEEALTAAVQNAGGLKAISAKLWPDVSPDVAAFRRDCLTTDALMHRLESLQDQLGGIMAGGKGIWLPFVLCEVGAKRRKLDLETAAADFDYWVQNQKVPCRATPTRP